MCLGKVLPPTTDHMIGGSVDPPMAVYGVISPNIRVKWPKVELC